MTLAELGKSLAKSKVARVDGTAVYLTANPQGVPGTILHNLKHNRVLHARNIVLSIRTASVPIVPMKIGTAMSKWTRISHGSHCIMALWRRRTCQMI